MPLAICTSQSLRYASLSAWVLPHLYTIGVSYPGPIISPLAITSCLYLDLFYGRVRCKRVKDIFIMQRCIMSLLWPVWASVEGFWEECIPSNGRYPFDLGPHQSNKKIQVAEPKLSLNSLNSYLDRMPCRRGQSGVAVRGKKEHHAQEWTGWNLEFSGKAFINLPSFVMSCALSRKWLKRDDLFRQVVTLKNQTDILRCMDWEKARGMVRDHFDSIFQRLFQYSISDSCGW